jgi:hypothetical protein
LGNQKTKQDDKRKRQNEKHNKPVACFQGHADGRVCKKSAGVNHSDIDEAARIDLTNGVRFKVIYG